MNLNPFALLERLIEEHGSSSIQGKHLAMLKDEVGILQRKDVELTAKVQRLETENNQLREQLQQLAPTNPPGDKCPFCNLPSGGLKELKRHPQPPFAHMGFKIGYYECSNPQCGKTYERQVKQ